MLRARQEIPQDLADVGREQVAEEASARRLQCRGVVDTVAGHGYDLALRGQGLDDPQLVLRGHPGIDRSRSDQLRKPGIVELSGGVAIIRVGATTEAEMARKKEAFDDAINATKAAIAEGVVPGGGVALVRATAAVDEAIASAEGDELTGMKVLRQALAVPCRQIAENAALDPGVVVQEVTRGSGFYGLDARDKTYKQLDEAGVLDPAKVVRVALENAVGVASTLLLAEVTMTDVEDTPVGPAPMPDMPMM